ncbi:hypothetical protein NGB36_18735 [Streptomyces sp. RB6PN25]|uniref:PH domain-containing protein n=1 Tax=Streptomyces humicola TaxID=2953240 RepID=A0ABT1PZM8_9ACTN|nr:hypothetical protein [Streptomyces humicola]MCQ4082583.1 hypothetical protein [Streptomyces humicola]
MTALRFTLPTRQAWTPIIGVGVLLLIAVIAGGFGALGVAVPFVFFAVMLFVIYFVVMFGSYSTFDETGIHSKRGIYRHKVTWDQVREVKLDPKSGQVLMVYKHHGRPFKLGAPISGGFSTDPEYRAKVAHIQEFVRAHIG